MGIAVWGVYLCLFIALYFEVFLLITFFEKKPAQKSAARPKRYPTVSIIVPCFNEEKTVAQTVGSLLALDYPKHKLDIVIVDDGSTDQTRAIGEALAAQHPERVHYFYKQNGGKWTALNFGIEHSTAKLVGCLDADSFVAKDSLIEAIKTFEASPATMAITPAMKVYRPRKILELMQAVEYTFGIFYKKMFDNLSAINVLPGPFSLYRREVFEKIGLFRHAHNTEDMEIAFRMHAHGLKISNAHNAEVYTTVPTTVRALVKQRTRWSQGFLQNSKDYSYMYLNPRFGHFGMLVLPLGLLAFFLGIYAAGYTFIKFFESALNRIITALQTGVPLQPPAVAHLTWYYLNTSMMTFLVIAVLCMTLAAIAIGQRLAKTQLNAASFLSYFLLFGLVAPIWLVRAALGAALARESHWR